MHSRQERRLNMFRAVEKHCDDNLQIIQTATAFSEGVLSLKANIAQILLITQQKELSKKGISLDKLTAKQALCRAAADLTAPIFAYAAKQKNQVLQQQVNFSYTALMRTKDEELAPRIQNFAHLAQTNLPALLPYGINAVNVANLKEAIENYSAKVPNPKNAKSNTKTLNANLRTIFSQTSDILKNQLDKTIVILKTTNPDFVETYKANRKI